MKPDINQIKTKLHKLRLETKKLYIYRATLKLIKEKQLQKIKHHIALRKQLLTNNYGSEHENDLVNINNDINWIYTTRNQLIDETIAQLTHQIKLNEAQQFRIDVKISNFDKMITPQHYSMDMDTTLFNKLKVTNYDFLNSMAISAVVINGANNDFNFQSANNLEAVQCDDNLVIKTMPMQSNAINQQKCKLWSQA